MYHFFEYGGLAANRIKTAAVLPNILMPQKKKDKKNREETISRNLRVIGHTAGIISPESTTMLALLGILTRSRTNI